MQLPGFLYGPYREVKAACSRLVTQLKRGAPWEELPERLGGGMIDTREVSGLLVLDGPSSLLSGDHFHLFGPARAILFAMYKRLPEDTYTTVFEPAIATRWGFLTMLGQAGQAFVFRPGHQQAMLHASLRWWDELMAQGPRWLTGGEVGESLWDLPTTIKSCLAREGLPEHLWHAPLPPGGLAELVAMTRAGLPPTRDQMH